MENVKSSNSALHWVLGLGLLAATAFGYYEYKSNEIVKKQEARVSAKADSLAFIKNQLQDNLEVLEAELETEVKERELTEQELSELKSKIAKQKKASALAWKNRKNELDALQEQKDTEIASLQGEIVDLTTRTQEMEEQLKQIPILEGDNSRLTAEIAEWEEKYAALTEDFNTLNKRYARLIFDAPGDQFRVEVLEKTNKITARANKADKVVISFMMPEYLQTISSETKMLHLSLVDDSAEPLKGSASKISVKGGGNTIPVPVHATQKVDMSKNPQVVTFTYELDEKLEPGVYHGRVYAVDDYLGTVDFKLRGGLFN